MMVRLPIAVLVCLLLLHSCVHGVLIRVRLGDGTLRRVDMDGQEVTSQEKLRSFLQQQGIIDSTSTSKLKVKDSILDITESHESIEEGVFIWKPGEIVEVIEVNYLKFKSKMYFISIWYNLRIFSSPVGCSNEE